MTIFPIHSETLKTLYTRGYISPEALTAIAPITWLAENFPELLDKPEASAKAVLEEPPLVIAPKTCKSCIHFASTHQFCKTRIDEDLTYLPVEETTPACKDFEGVELPTFLNTGGKS